MIRAATGLLFLFAVASCGAKQTPCASCESVCGANTTWNGTQCIGVAPAVVEPIPVKDETPTGDDADALAEKILAELTVLSEKMCECSDKPCADAVNVEFEAMGQKYEDAPRPSQDIIDRLLPVMEEYAKCQMNLTTPAP